MTFVVQRCACGHTAGDHQSGGTTFPHPVRRGVCLSPGCGCREFAERPEVAKDAER